MNKPLAVSSQLPKLIVPVFLGEPLHYQLWQNTFNALINSKPLDVDTKLNYLIQSVSGKPRHVVEHYMLIRMEEANQNAQEMCFLIGTATLAPSVLRSLQNWRSGARYHQEMPWHCEISQDFIDKVSTARLTIPSLGILNS